MNRNDVDWHGILAVLVTPFTEDGKIDEESYRRIVELSIDDGVHGIITCGSTGEFYAMSREERGHLCRITVDQVHHRVPVICGASASCTSEVVELGQQAANLGADGTMIVPPYYARPNEREIVAFFKEISERTPLPIMLYNNPRRTGVNLVPRIVGSLAEIERVVAIKDSSKDFLQVCELVQSVGDRLRIFTGEETMLLGCVAMGADGAIALISQAMGRIPVELYEAARRGDYLRARDLQKKVARFYDALAIGNLFSALKEAMNQTGRPGGFPRKPLLPLTPDERDRVRSILQEIGFTVSEPRNEGTCS